LRSYRPRCPSTVMPSTPCMVTSLVDDRSRSHGRVAGRSPRPLLPTLHAL
jgi:hypothetical protein